MADVNRDRFEQRLAAIAPKHHPDARVKRHVTQDGLIVEVVKRDLRALFPIKGFMTGFFLFIALKGSVLAQLGAGEYLSRIDRLKDGNTFENVAAVLFAADPVTQSTATVLSPYFR